MKSVLSFVLGMICFQTGQAVFLELIPDDVQFNTEGKFINPTQLSTLGYSFDLNKNFIQKESKTYSITKDDQGRFIFSAGLESQTSKQFDLQHVFFNSSYRAEQLTFCNGLKTKSFNPFKSDILRCQVVNQRFCDSQKSRLQILFPETIESAIFKVVEACKIRLIKENKVSAQCREYFGKIDTMNEFSYSDLKVDQKKIEDKNQELLAAMKGSAPSFKVDTQISYVSRKNDDPSEYLRSIDAFTNSFELCRHLNAIDRKPKSEFGVIQNSGFHQKINSSVPASGSHPAKVKRAQ